MRPINKHMFLILFMLFFSVAYSFESNKIHTGVKYEFSTKGFEKLFVDQVISDQQGVFLRVGDVWIVTEGLQATSEGMLVLIYGDWMTVEDAMKIPECRRGTWECSRCHFINYEGISVCGVCGKPRYA
jgi:hypothetical protein